MSPAYRFVQKVSYFLSGIYSSRLNPVYYLGGITVFLLIMDIISGIYLFFFYEVDPKRAYDSVEAISSSMLGSLMRGIHRYSSDGLILFAVLHMLHMILTDRFRLFRWVAWVSGVGTLLIFIVIGISGYLLVWDERAQLTGLLIAKFFSVIPLFGHALMSAFLGTDVKNLGGLFRILLFGHIAVTVLLLFTLWVHVMRISRPRLFPPKELMILITFYTVLVAFLFPAKSDPPADLGKIPFGMSLDWFYLTGFPLFKVFPLSINWVLLVGFFGFLTVFPWLIRGRKNPPARVDETRCEGCRQCFEDCPYEAIYIKGKGEKGKAFVIEDKCAGCGICVASCIYGATSIDTVLYESIKKEIKISSPYLTVFRCPFSASVEEREGVRVFVVPCVGAVNAVWMKEVLNHSKGVMLVSCEEPDCYFREGVRHTEERYKRLRRPRLLRSLEGGRIRIVEVPGAGDVSDHIEDFLDSLRENESFSRDVVVVKRGKLNPLLAPTLLLLPFLTFYPLTTDRMSFYPTDRSLLAITFKYRSSPIKEKGTFHGKLEHMKAGGPIAVERSPVELSLIVDGREMLKKRYNPRGLRKDSSIYVYEEVLLKPGKRTIELKLTEMAGSRKETTFRLRGKLREATNIVISYEEGRGFFVLKAPE